MHNAVILINNRKELNFVVIMFSATQVVEFLLLFRKAEMEERRRMEEEMRKRMEEEEKVKMVGV